MTRSYLLLLLPLLLLVSCGDDDADGARFARINSDTAPTTPAQPARNTSRATVAQEERKQIDAWLRLNQAVLNAMGDSIETMYAGVPEPFRTRGDDMIDRYEYIALRHSDRPWSVLNAEQTRQALAIPDTAGRAEREARLAKERRKKGEKDPWDEKPKRRAKKKSSAAPKPAAPKPATQ